MKRLRAKDDVLKVIATLINNPVGFLIIIFLVIGAPIKYPSIRPYLLVLFCIILYALLINFLFSKSGATNFYSKTKNNIKIILELIFSVILCSLLPWLVITGIIELISKQFADKYYYYILFICLLGTLIAVILFLNDEKDDLKYRMNDLEVKLLEMRKDDKNT